MPATLLNEPPLNPIHELFRVERILEPEGDAPKRRHKVIAVLPAYNAERTLAATLADFPAGCVDEILLVDDGSTDRTVEIAVEMGLTVIKHPKNRGYGGNQKTCYRYALEHGADVVVMIHPDYQYDARVIPHAVALIELGICDVVMGSRIRSRREALKCGMPWWKYVNNRILTSIENVALGQNLGDFHSGFRVYRRGLERRRRRPGPGAQRDPAARRPRHRRAAALRHRDHRARRRIHAGGAPAAACRRLAGALDRRRQDAADARRRRDRA